MTSRSPSGTVPPGATGGWTRRGVVGGLGLSALGLGLSPIRALAAPDPSQLKFIFVVNYGGWDPTRVFASEFSNRLVDMERDAGEARLGDLRYVAHADRPAVDAYFARYAASSVIVNGVLVPSIAHENCLKLAMTGTSADGAADWAAILGSDQLSGFALPHVVVGGPSFPGELGSAVTRTGSSGQLDGLLSGEIIDWSDVRTAGPGRRAEDIMDRYMTRRAAAAADAAASVRDQNLKAAFAASLDRSHTLKDLQSVVNWDGGTGLPSQARLATDVLSMGISRCATLSFTGTGWDSHTDNDTAQSTQFEGLFTGLLELMSLLDRAPGQSTATLREETVVVVMSEMGRTPALNDADGKDHWPYTSVLLTGPGITGGRVVGGFDSLYYGLRIDPDSGELSEDGLDIASSSLGATLLQLAGIDHEVYLPGTLALPGLLG